MWLGNSAGREWSTRRGHVPCTGGSKTSILVCVKTLALFLALCVHPGYVIFPEGKGLGLAKFRIISKQNDVCTLERVPYSTYVLHSDIKPESVKRHANAGASRTMVQQLGQPFHADLQPVLAPLETPFDDLPMLVKEKQDRKNDLLASRGASRMVHVAMRELF